MLNDINRSFHYNSLMIFKEKEKKETKERGSKDEETRNKMGNVGNSDTITVTISYSG